MRIFFEPELTGPVYLKADDNAPVLMDTMATGLAGLVSLLELRCGIHHEDVPEQQRLVLYYNAMRKYMDDNPGNILEKSFQASGLGTARAVLNWRDQLLMTGWQPGDNDSQRLTAISEIEKNLDTRLQDCDLSMRIYDLIDIAPDCNDITLVLACDLTLYKPIVKALLNKMLAAGAQKQLLPQAELKDNNLAKVRRLIAQGSDKQITLDPQDDSFKIWRFPNDHVASEYLAQLADESFDVWINSDNKQMDNWLALMNKPATGSVMTDCSPQLSQLFITGVALHTTTLNVKTLIEWLNMPVHPINKYFRSILADTIAQSGGYRNDKCRKLVNDYIDGQYVYLDEQQKALPKEEIQAIRDDGRNKRAKLVEVFLPTPEPAKLSADKLTQFVNELSAWARIRARLMEEKNESPMWIEQLYGVAAMADAFGILISANKGMEITDHTIDGWLTAIFDKASYTHAIAVRGCRTVLDNPSKLLSVADNVIWMGLNGDNIYDTECPFLFPTEKAALAMRHNYNPWPEDNLNAYNKIMTERAFSATSKKLVLSYCDLREGEETAKHPFMVLLEQKVSNLNEFIISPKIEEDKLAEVVKITNEPAQPEQNFDHADLIKWPDHLSPTKVETLVQYPFDYLMSDLLGIESDCQVQMSDTRTTEGNVAHKVIETLFAPRDGEPVSTPDEIKKRISIEYNQVFDKTIESEGAIFQLEENKLAAKLLKEQLQESINILVGIIADNFLKVTGCEKFVHERMEIGLNNDPDKSDMLGYIDMTLEDKNKKPVVFDFKWTRSKNKYPELLKKNRSVQLEMYRHMLGAMEGDTVERTAYYLMPQNKLFSKELFVGSNCQQIKPDNNDEIVGQLCKSISYRKAQIERGVVENAVGMPIEDLKYDIDTDLKGLYPLKTDDNQNKEANQYSDYKLFY